jgi:hypothetical protein
VVERLKQTVREHRVVAIALAALALIAVLVAVLALNGSAPRRSSQPHVPMPTTSHTTSSAHSAATPDPAATPTASATSSSVAALPQLLVTADPAGYARAAALALFQIDPATSTRATFLEFWRRQLPTVVYTDAAANGLTLAEQNHDAIDNLTRWWIPPQQVWDSEATDHTRSRFTITSVTVPDYWANAVANGTYRDPGLHMERVMGVLTQTYDTSDATRGSVSASAIGAPPASPAGTPGRGSTSRAVVIDLGLLCGPTQPGGCRLVAPQKPPALGAS